MSKQSRLNKDKAAKAKDQGQDSKSPSQAQANTPATKGGQQSQSDRGDISTGNMRSDKSSGHKG